MDNRGQVGTAAGSLAAILIALLLFDAFFCGCWLFDQAIFDVLEGATG